MTHATTPTAVIFGAGSVGRGFLGQLFSESGYDVVFVDVDAPLVAALNARGHYTLRLAGVVKTTTLSVGPVRSVDGRDTDAVAEAVAGAALMATAVGARALPAIAPAIAQGLMQRRAAGDRAPLNVIVCENLHDAPDRLRGHVRASLAPHEDAVPDAAALEAGVGFVPAVIARMSPVPTAGQRAEDPTLIVAEPYKVLPVDREAFVGPPPEVVGMVPVAPFAAYTARKLYIHNAGHALLGYLGYHKNYTYGYAVLDDPWVRQRLDRALGEARRALVAAYAFEPVAFQEHIDYLLVRFANRALADPITRLARDPLRKLRPEDRLVGAAHLAEQHGIEPAGLAWGIAAALRYDHPDDGHAVELQARVAQDGLTATLADLCDIQPDEPLAALVRERYGALGEGD